jgi:chemotaxis protein histidine kinase CheA
MSFNEEELKEFKVEATELLDMAEKSLLALTEQTPFREHYDAVFRAFHSIKGAAGMMDLNDLQAHVHQVESILTDLKEEKCLARKYVYFFLKAIDASRALLEDEKINFQYEIETTITASESSAAKSRTPKEAAFPEAKAVTTEQILVAGHDLLMDLMFDSLIGAGFQVHRAFSVHEFLQKVQELSPSLVLTNLQDSDANPGAFLQQVCQARPGLPTILVGENFDRDLLLQAFEYRIFALLNPSNNEQIFACCREALDQAKWVSLSERSVQLVLSQYADLDSFLLRSGNEVRRRQLHSEVREVLNARRELSPAKAKVA